MRCRRRVALALPFALVAWLHWLLWAQRTQMAPTAPRARLARVVDVRAASQRVAQSRWGAASAGAPTAAGESRGASTAALLRADACPNSPPRPYHVLLTASSGSYQEWQTRVFYHHYTRVRAADTCGEVGGFTRLLTLPEGKDSDTLSSTMRTVVVRELKKGTEDLGFIVLNRPHSVELALRTGAAPPHREGIRPSLSIRPRRAGLLGVTEEYILIAETDHIPHKPMPNLARPGVAVGYPFHYMHPTRDARTAALVRRFGGERHKEVQQVGPSPVLIHVADLRRLAPSWRETSFELKRDAEADAEFGCALFHHLMIYLFY